MAVADINFLFSTDYELFFGRNLAPEKEILIDTTDELLRTCEELEVPLTLFCDITSVWRYQELGMSEFPDQVQEQCVEAVKRGHDVQTHLHPHWLKADFTDGQWSFSPETFLAGRWGQDEAETFKYLNQWLMRAKNDFESWIKPVAPNYQCIAFRAGGYGLQPREKTFIKALIDSGYVIDSSVNPGMIYRSQNNAIDFTNVPEQANYFLSPESGLNQTAPQGLYEIPVAAGRMSLPSFTLEMFLKAKQKVMRKLRKDKDSSSWARRGKGAVAAQEEGKQTVAKRINERLERINRRWNALNLHPGSDPEIMFQIAKMYVKRAERNQQGPLFFAGLTHSKTITAGQLNCLREFVKKMKKHYGSSFSAVHHMQVAEHLQKSH